MRREIVIMAAAAGFVGCAHGGSQAPRPPAALEGVTNSIAQLRAAVQETARGPEGMMPGVASAIRAAAQALSDVEVPIPRYQRLLLDRMRLDADALVAAPAGSLLQANVVRGALDVALLLSVENPLMRGSATRVGLQVVEARQALERIDPHAPAAEQHPPIAEALLAVANAVALAGRSPAS